MAIFADNSGGYCTCFPKQVNVNSYGRLNSCKGCYLSIPDEQSIYVAFRYVADMRNVGTKGLHRKSYIIKDIIQKQLYQPGVEELLKKYRMASLISTLQTLLEGGIFTTHFAAKRRFPDLDHDTPTVCCKDEKPSEDIGAYRGPTETATEEKTDWEPEEATKPSCSYDDWPCEPEVAEEEEEEPKAAEPLPEVTEDEPYMKCDITLHTNDIPTSDTPTEEEKPKPADSEQSSEAPEDCDMTPKSPCKKANIDAKYLERACFAYGRREIPATLSLNNWDCAEAVPLEHWMREFLDQSQNFSTIINNKNLKLLFKRVCKIQEVASQRIHIESDVLRRFLEDACELVHVLGDEKYKDLIGEFKSDIEKVLEDTQHKNTAYQNRRDGKLQQIESERAKLDKLEKAIRDEMDRDIRESQSMAKVEVRNALGKAAVTFETEIEWKEDKAE